MQSVNLLELALSERKARYDLIVLSGLAMGVLGLLFMAWTIAGLVHDRGRSWWQWVVLALWVYNLASAGRMVWTYRRRRFHLVQALRSLEQLKGPQTWNSAGSHLEQLEAALLAEIK